MPLLVFAAMAVMFGYALQTGDPSRLPSALLGKPAPKLDLPPLGGLAEPIPGLAAGDFTKGKVTVVNFWASWCGPCRDEHPVIEELKKRSTAHLVGINYKDPAPGSTRFLTQYGNPYDAIGVDASGRAGIEWGVYGMPETFVVDPAGRVAYKHVGPMSPKDLEEKILPAITAAQASKGE